MPPVTRSIAWTYALDGVTIDIRRPHGSGARHGADETDFALRNIFRNTQLLAGVRRAWPSVSQMFLLLQIPRR